MADQNQSCSGVAVSIAFLSGALMGAVAAVLYTPKSGAETRTALRGYVRRTEDEVLEKIKSLCGLATMPPASAVTHAIDPPSASDAALSPYGAA